MVRKAGDSNPPIPPFPPPPPIISYKKGTSLKDTLVKAKKKFEGDYAMRLQKSHGESVPVSLSLIRFQESKQDLMDSSLLNKRETGSS